MSALDAARLIVYIAAVPAVLFPTLYFFRSPWQSTLVGKMMMTKSSSIGLLFVLSVLRASGVNVNDWVLVGSYAYLAVALYVQLAVLLIEQGRRHAIFSDNEAREVGDEERDHA